MSKTTDPTAALRDRALELLAREGRAIHTGELASQLGVPTHEVQTALHHPYQTGKVYFASSEGWSLPPAAERMHVDDQEQLV